MSESAEARLPSSSQFFCASKPIKPDGGIGHVFVSELANICPSYVRSTSR